MAKPFWLMAILVLAGCTTVPGSESGGLSLGAEAPPPRPAIVCSDGFSALDSGFSGSAMAGCEVVGRGHYRLLIRQEDPNVTNCSAWYAFRARARSEEEIVVDLDYERCGHRYVPKVWTSAEKPGGQPCVSAARIHLFCEDPSEDIPGANSAWEPLGQDRYSVEEDDGEVLQARLAIKTSPAARIISAQELVLPADYAAWLDSLEGRPGLTRSVLGQSLEGAPIEQITIAEGDVTRRGQLYVIGRQHPPEVTGAFALFAFTERLLEDDALARAFRQRFTTTIVPLMNPDGVTRGHWRHSRGERDMNRDWGPFTQPETRLVRDRLEAIEADPTKDLKFFIDFHSTGRDVLYTLDKSLITQPPEFTDQWVEDYQARLPDYEVAEQPGHNPESPVSKAWVYERFGIPTMTYEVGDETDRQLIRRLGRAAAESTITRLLAENAATE